MGKQTRPEAASSETGSKKPTTAPGSTASDNLIIVGIGASAGGLPALQKVLPGLPVRLGAAYIIAQHLSPKHHSVLPSLLARQTEMPVETIKDGMAVAADTIYITPPDREVSLCGNRLRLNTASAAGPKPSIDVFFNSLAMEKRCRAVGIVLSGTGCDGAHGIRAIKANEGITVAQTSTSAKFYGMPQAAVDTGFVDMVLPPEMIGRALESALNYPRQVVDSPPPETPVDAMRDILRLVREGTGMDFGEYRSATLHRRIHRRMAILNLADMQDYAGHLRDHPEEQAVLKRDMLILATRFFRNSKAFDALAGHLRNLLEGKREGDRIRIWVPACSSGEEAYSIAILMADLLGNSLGKYRVQIFATDIDDNSIQLARKGVYPLATVPESHLIRHASCFVRHETNIAVTKHIRDMVVLARQDLLKDTPFLHLDLISCRNLLADLNPGMRDKLLDLFHYLLDPKGILFLGQSESIERKTDRFDPIDERWKLYRRGEASARQLPKLMQTSHAARQAPRKDKCTQQDETLAWKKREFIDSLVNLLGCCGVLTDEHANILYLRGDVSPYFKFPEGSIKGKFNVVRMARPQIRYVLQSMLSKITGESQPITSNTIALKDSGGGRGVRIRIGPVPTREAGYCRLIVFTPVEIPGPAPDPLPEAGDPRRVARLERELAEARDLLQDMGEELETSTEELQSLNEELQVSNEELQAANEELETSNEELQASNEELGTVNDELRAKSEEADELMHDLTRSEARYRQLVDRLDALVKDRTAALETTVAALNAASEEQRKTERELRRLSKVFMDSSDPIIIEDMDTTIVDLNRAAEDVYGFGRDALIGQSIKKIIPEHRHEPAEELRRRCLAGETIHDWEGTRRDRTGQSHPVLVTAFALKDALDKPESIATIAKDISKIKSMQEEMERRATQLARLSNELTLAEQRERRRLAKVLHDHLQQLLAGAKIKLDILREEHSGVARKELQSVLQMISESLKTSRSLAAELSPPVLYQHGLERGLDWLARWMRKTHGLEVELNLDPAAAPEKEELKGLLFESVRELLFNVVKHADTRTARVEMGCRENQTVILVADSGSGFDPQGMWREEMGTETGFGLFNIRERLQLIGGFFDIDSRPGKGTTVTLKAPLQKGICVERPHRKSGAKCKADRIVPQPNPRRENRSRSGRLRVMLVDDHAVMRNGLSAMLSRHAEIEIAGEAADGEEAILMARRIHPDVILMDINMPKMNGVEATRVISAELPDIRIYALSMYDAEDQSPQMIEAGAVGYLNKGGGMDELLAAILQTATAD